MKKVYLLLYWIAPIFSLLLLIGALFGNWTHAQTTPRQFTINNSLTVDSSLDVAAMVFSPKCSSTDAACTSALRICDRAGNCIELPAGKSDLDLFFVVDKSGVVTVSKIGTISPTLTPATISSQ